MGYYVRILTPESNPASPALVQKAAQAHGAIVTGDVSVKEWEHLVVANSANQEVCAIERNVISAGSLGEEEIVEFQDEAAGCLPGSAAIWLESYLRSVRTIYAFQVLSGTYSENGWEIFGSVKEAVHSSVGGIMQADNEGFSNEEGYHILWQFSDDVSGDWWMAVLKDGRWEKFKMDLSNRTHRTAFMAGDIPNGVERTR